MPTLQQYRRQLAQELGGYVLGTASSGSSTTAVAATAFQSTELTATSLAYEWFFSPAAADPRQRRIKAAGLDPTTATITLDAALGTAVTTGTIFELHTLLPAQRESSTQFALTPVMGANECVNLAARHIRIPCILSVPLVDGQYEYSLPYSTYPWLNNPALITDVQQLTADGQTYIPTAQQGHTWTIQEDTTGLTVVFDQPYHISSGSYSVSVFSLRPADTWVNNANSGAGLVAETDQSALSVNDMVTVAKAFAYAAIRDSRPEPMRSVYAGLYEEQWALAKNVRNFFSPDQSPPAGPVPPQGVAA